MTDVDVERSANVLELLRLSQVPRVRELLAERLEKAGKGGWKKLGAEYDNTKNMYQETLFGKYFQVKGQKGKKAPPPLYWFELTRYKHKQGEEAADAEWRITVLLDKPGSQVKFWEVPPYDILPRDVVNKISQDRVESGKVFTMAGIKSTRTGKTMDVSYLWYSDTFIMGTVEHRQRPASRPETADSPTPVKPDKENAYRLFHHLKKIHPQEVQAFKRDFMLKWLKQKKNSFTQGDKDVR